MEENEKYNENVRAMIEQAARAGAMEALKMTGAPLKLENENHDSFLPSCCGGNDMATKQQFKVTLPNGQTVWAGGNSVSDAFVRFAAKYGPQLAGSAENAQPQKTTPTVRAFVDKVYRESFMADLKPTTQVNYEGYLKSYILPFLGEMLLTEVNVVTIQQFYHYMAHESEHGKRKNLNRKTIERVRGLTSRIFEVAQEMGLIKDTPFKNKILKINAEPGGHHKALPDEEIDRVKSEIPSLAHPEIRLYFALLAYTGMRREEIMGLHWEDVDLEDAIAYVCCTVTYPQRNHPVIQYSAKSECSIRPVLLPSALVQLMKPLARKSGFLFGGERPWCYSTMTRRAKQGRELLNVKEFNNHDYRTTFGSQLKESGMTSAQVADLMGHADTRMVETVYARRRTSGVMKQKSVLDELNSAYVV